MRNINSRGFTLIEMMIAIFIALIIFTIGFSAISTTIAARRESEARVKAAESARIFFTMLRKDLDNAYPNAQAVVNLATLVQENPNQALHYAGSNLVIPFQDRIEFLTRADARNTTDQYIFVRYFVNTKGQLCSGFAKRLRPSHYPLATTLNHPFVPDGSGLAPTGARPVQLIPSGLVITSYVTGTSTTAMNRFSSGDQHTDFHCALSAGVRTVHVMPSGEVITYEDVEPPPPVATNSARDELQHTDFHAPLSAVRFVHVMPSGLVIT